MPGDEQLRRGAAGWVGCGVELPAGRPGLYFVGLPFLDAYASMLVGGVAGTPSGWSRISSPGGLKPLRWTCQRR